jgi:hypothetical protein
MAQYKTCSNCGANLDPEETCDCKEEKLKVSETYIISFDISVDKDVSMIQVCKFDGSVKAIRVINTIQGEEAEKLYEKITGIKI